MDVLIVLIIPPGSKSVAAFSPSVKKLQSWRDAKRYLKAGE
jgi:hypothetical protein